ncbi:peroxiredoxin family protein [Smaragdicoccus niigatensis]|uniref:peroxiredoxin family protein n=1 Tax=Smaragdicoccus niigatensis TaxID=359359 RepID=UPI00036C0B65|nr:TlpA disulfide reductase family protein [Smaragdicoccus niigatensis]
MTNPLTGDYEAVVQIATRQINGLLATLHNNSDHDARIQLVRHVVTRIGDPGRRPPDFVDFADWVVGFQKELSGGGLEDLHAHITATAPPGIAKKFTETLDRFTGDWGIELPPTPPDVVRGIAKVQVSTVTITVSPGSSSEVTVHAHIRAKFYPDPETNTLPEPIHGELTATYNVRPTARPGGLRLLISPTADDSKIQFVAAPGSGISTFDQNRISTHVRTFVRHSIVQQPIDVPAGFPFTEFKGLGSGTSQVIALPMQLSGGAPPPNRISSLTQSFAGSNGFALAVSKEHILSFFNLDSIVQAIERQTVTAKIGYGWFSYSATYHFQVSDFELTFHDGVLKVSGRIDAVASGAPDAWITFTQSIRLVLDAAAVKVTVERAGDPEVDESVWLPHGPVVTRVRQQFDTQLPSAGGPITTMIRSNRTKLVNSLNELVPGLDASFAALDVTSSGIVIRGELTGGARNAPVVDIAETHGGTAFTALKSWVPGGRIDRFIWSWVEYPPTASIWNGVARSRIDEHGFIVPTPAGITDIGQICLSLEGTQVLPSGALASVVGGSTCLVPEPVVALDVPSWWGPLTVPLWRPVAGDRGPLRQAISGHLSVAATAPHDGKPQRNALVFFAGDQPLTSLFQALRLSKHAGSVSTTVVVPAGTFDKSRTDVESQLALTDGPRVVITEDDEKAWTTAFDVSKTPSAFLMNTRRELVWHSDGALDPKELASALDKLTVGEEPPSFRPLTTNLATGDSPRNFTFADQEDQYALHHLRGRDVVLAFWQSWSAPCLAELQHLQSLCEGRTGPFVAAFHGGTSAEPIEEVRKRLGLSFPLVHDPQQRLARQFGIRCWPTTIRIGSDGRVEHIQLGSTHDHGRSDPKAT